MRLSGRFGDFGGAYVPEILMPALEQLESAFGAFGEVSSATVITDKFSGQSKGFGFVEMPDSSAAAKAIQSLNGTPIAGRNVKVNEAKPREDRPQRPRY